MDEGDARAAGAGLGYLVDQRRALLPKLGHRRFDILDLDADMVEPLAALVEESRHPGIRRSWADQLDPTHSASENGGLHLLAGDFFDVVQLEPQHVAVEGDRRIEVLHRDG